MKITDNDIIEVAKSLNFVLTKKQLSEVSQRLMEEGEGDANWSIMVEDILYSLGVSQLKKDDVLTDDLFGEIYKPQINHFERAKQNDSVDDEDICSFNGCMYETYGEELQYIFNLAKTTKKVWTIIEGESNTLFYSAGFHYVNRIGFIVCHEEYVDETIQIEID
jgi:hypothetical protein